MQWLDVKQNTDEWDLLRAGKPTASNMGTVMANFGKAFGDPAKKYAINIALEQITGRKISGGFSNGDMDRGHVEEPLAITMYEDRFFCSVTNGGFYDLGNFGCSPDGKVGSGTVEAKSAIPSIHYERICRKSTCSTTYDWQIISTLKATEAEYLDFLSYCQDFHDDGKLYVIRFRPEQFKAEFRQIDERLAEFHELIQQSKSNILSGNYYNI